jgi:hypothetical protein
MNKAIKILIGLLAAQVALAGLLFFTRGGMGAFDSDETLLELGADDFDQAILAEPGKEPLSLVKKDGKWTIPSRWNFPASSDKIAQTLDKLRDMKKSWPVGETASARKRFKVTEEAFEKKIAFMKGGKEKKVLFLGTSPSYRKVHARPADSDKVFAADFSAYEVSVRAEDWEDKKFLQVDRTVLSRIETPTVRVVKKDLGFQVEDLKEAEETNTSEMDSFLSLFSGLSYIELLGREIKPDYGLSAPALTLNLETASGEKITYNFGKPKTGEDFFLKASNADYVFKVSRSVFEALKAVSREKLTRKKSPPKP